MKINVHPPPSTRHPSEPAVPGPDAKVADSPVLGLARLSSRAIFAGAREIEIEHDGALYRLRQTSLGKLILTK